MQAATALLIIDVQRGFINEHTRHIPSLVEELQVQEKYSVVCATQFRNETNSPFVRWLDWHRLMDRESTELAFTPTNRTLVVPKESYNSITAKITSLFEQHQIKEVHLCGIDTNMCVFVSATTLFEQGIYEPFVLSQYCASHSGAEYHKSGLMLLEKAIGKRHIL